MPKRHLEPGRTLLAAAIGASGALIGVVLLVIAPASAVVVFWDFWQGVFAVIFGVLLLPPAFIAGGVIGAVVFGKQAPDDAGASGQNHSCERPASDGSG